MKFVDLQSLFLIWAVPVLFLFCFYGMQRRKRIMRRFAKPEGLKAVCPEASAMRRWIKSMLLLSAVLFSAVALAGPQCGFKWQEIEQKGVDIILAVDCSRSMLAEDVKPSRLARAKREILDLVSILKGDRVGLVAFAGTAFLQCPLTLDYSGFHIFLDVLSPDFLPVGGTDLNRAIATALKAFEEKGETEKAIILITDGETTRGDPMKGALSVSRAGVKLFCIGVGNPDGVPVPEKGGGFKKDSKGGIVLSRLDESMLKEMALATGGAYVRSVAGDMDLDLIYVREIRGKMRTETVSAGKKKIWQNRFQWALAIALFAFSIELLISSADPKKNFRSTACLLMSISLLSSGVANAEGIYEKMGKGLQAYENNNYDKAMEHFIEAQLDEPEMPEIAYNLGAAYYRSGDFDAAAKNFAHALNSQSPELRAKSFYNLGNANFRMGKYDQAVGNYETALKIKPEDREAAANLAFTKKLLEQQKQQQQSDTKQNGKKEDRQQDSREQSSSEQQQQQQQRQAESDSDNASSRNQNAQNKSADSSKHRQQEQYASDPGENESAGTGKDPGEEQERQSSARPQQGKEPMNDKAQARDGEQKRVQAETMLNRLEDKPGRALMPAYGETRVEKDW